MGAGLDRRVTAGLCLLVFAAVAVVTTSPASTQGQGRRSRTERVRGHEAEAGEVLIKFRGTPSAEAVNRIERSIDAEGHELVGRRGARRMRSRSFDTEAVLSYLQAQPEVEYAEPNYILYAADTVPNDPKFSQLWGLRNLTFAGADIGAVRAWDLTTGSPSVAVGVIDSGIDYTHPDLAPNVWSAPSAFTVTLGGVSITCAAGTHGINTITNTCDPMDDNNHGTHVAGTIGARGNEGVGVAGVNWQSSLIGAKFLSATGSGSTSNAIKAIDFLIQVKQQFGSAADVRVLSNSWGGGGYSVSLLEAINAANAAGILFVAAAGNNAANNDTALFYPASYTAPNVVSVASTTSSDALSSFSNYGATTVDLGAPGSGIVSTTRGNTYASFSGTSMATPHVSGVAALVLARCNMDTAALKSHLMANVTPIAALGGITVTGGRLNADLAVKNCAAGPELLPPAPTLPAAPTGLSGTAGNLQAVLKWSASSGASTYRVKRGNSGGPYTTVADAVASTGFTETGLVNGTTYYYVVTAVNAAGESGNSNQVSVKPVLPPPAPPTALTAVGAGRRRIQLTWQTSAGAVSYTVRRATKSGGPYNIITSGLKTTSYLNSSLTGGRVYYYVVTATNAAGTSGYSNQASATAPK